MSNTLRFDPNRYEIKSCELDGRTITYRAFEDICYCAKPVDPIQKMNIYVPEIYYHKGEMNGYRLNTAPILIPNSVGGYMPGRISMPDLNGRLQIPNVVFEGLHHGYIVVCPGIRGRSSGIKDMEHPDENDKWVGRAPALLVDMKAAIRYLRRNRTVIPGDTERIITSGTSAGGALSAMTGVSGNSKDFAPYLEAIGAAEERDDVFASNCYCPIHNLENADAAYEWLFCGRDDFHRSKSVIIDGERHHVPVVGVMSEKQIALSHELKAMFPAYVNSLALKNPENGEPLTLDADGNGSFRDYVGQQVLKSANKELKSHATLLLPVTLPVPGSEVEKQAYLTFENGTAVGLDWDGFTKGITRMKSTPAFDELALRSPENEEFGTEEIFAQHFTEFSHRHSEVDGTLADPEIVKLINPLTYIGRADTTRNWRIRHGSYDRDTALAIPVILAVLLENSGCQVDFALPWGVPHSGDYDLDEMFSWIDEICKR